MRKNDVLALLADIEARAQKSARQKDGAYERGFKEHLDARDELCQRRFELVTGRSQPTADEMEGYSGPSGEVKDGKGVPFFWLNVLLGHDAISEVVSPRDRHALEYLEDVRFLRGNAGMVVEMHFAANPFFENKVLRRGIYVETDADGQPVRVREEGTAISWKEGRSLLLKEVATSTAHKKSGRGKKGKKDKKGKKGKGGKSAVAERGVGSEEDEDAPGGERRRRFKSAPSFFRFFLPISATSEDKREVKTLDPTALDDDADEDDVEEEEEEEEEMEGLVVGDSSSRMAAAARAAALRKDRDGEMLEMLLKQVVPRAVHLYLNGPIQVSGRSANKDGNEEDIEEDEDDGYQLVAGSGDSVGGVSALPPPAQKVLHALQHVQQRMDALAAGYKAAKWEASKVHDELLQQLANERRAALVVTADDGRQSLCVPNFWLRALRSQDTIVHIVQRRDERLLASLSDVRMSWDWERMASVDYPTREATVELHFLPNPYISNSVLRKRYTFGCAGGSMRRLNLEKSEVLEGPVWQEGKDLTSRPPLPGATKPRPTASFFCLFKKGALRQAFNITGEDKHSLSEAISAEEELVNELQSMVTVWPKELYDQVDMEDDLGEEEEEEEEEEEAEDADGKEGDDSSAVHRSGRKNRSASASTSGMFGFQLSKANVLLLLVGLVMFSQIFIFFEWMAGWKSTMS